jgi:hypothetical protein
MPPGGTYVQLTRDEFEEWLTRDLGFSPSEWRLKPGRGGVYQLFLSPTVAIEVNSTTGAQDAVMGRGNASMSLWLASRVNGKVLNKKAMGQSHFARTLNWRENWKKGVERMKDAYLKSKDFYDRLASNTSKTRSRSLSVTRTGRTTRSCRTCTTRYSVGAFCPRSSKPPLNVAHPGSKPDPRPKKHPSPLRQKTPVCPRCENFGYAPVRPVTSGQWTSPSPSGNNSKQAAASPPAK